MQPGRVVVDHRHHVPAAEEHVPRVPVAVDDLGLPLLEAELVRRGCAGAVRAFQGADCLGEFLGRRAFFDRQRADGVSDRLLDGRRAVVAALRGLVVAAEVLEQLVVEAENLAGVERRVERGVVAGTLDELEHLVDARFPDEHGVVVVPRAEQVRQGEVLAGKGELDLVSEGHLGHVVLALGAALEEELAPLALDDQLGRAARAASKLLDARNNAQVEMAQRNRQLAGTECLTYLVVSHDGKPTRKTNLNTNDKPAIINSRRQM